MNPTNNPYQVQIPLKFLFSAVFSDLSEFHQNSDDKDSVDPTKSSFTEYLRICESKKPIAFSLESDSDIFTVDLETGEITRNGAYIFNPNFNTEGVDLRVVYVRQVKLSQVQPALFNTPKGYKKLETGQLQIKDREGNDHIFPETSRLFIEKSEGGEEKYVVYPTENTVEVSYTLGWQTTMMNAGKLENVQKVITIS